MKLDPYMSNRSKDTKCISLRVPTSLVDKIDEWGVGSGQTSRNNAIAELIKRGLDVEANECKQ